MPPLEIKPEVIERLLPLLPLRIVVRRDEKGQMLGLTENSFSMGWERDRVKVYWSGKYYSNLGTTGTIDAVEDAKYHLDFYSKHYQNVKVLDPTKPNCPIQIDWEKWLSATTKYDKRNAPFEVSIDLFWSNYTI